MASTPSFNAQVAKDGFEAETILCQDPRVAAALSGYFGKPVKTIGKVAGRKKSDLLVTFEDGTTSKIQNKNGTGGGRGWSCDRRALEKMPICPEGTTLLGNVCLKRGTERPTVVKQENLAPVLFLGTEEAYMPTHFLHTEFDKTTKQIVSLSICSKEAFMEAIQKEMYDTLVAKRTCVHLSPRIYLQRKSGGAKDHAPDDIQVKLKSLPEIMTSLSVTPIPPPTV